MFEVITVIAIPFIINLLKKIKLPTKIAPIAAFVLALVIVAGGKILGFDLNIQTLIDAIIKALAISGVSVLGYDAIKKLSGK